MIILLYSYLFITFICWGSFLNAVAYRIIFQEKFSLLTRSQCPHCHMKIAWYDLLPVISFCALKGRCRQCKHSISTLYPFIELLTACTLTWLAYTPQSQYFFAYFLFFSALIITVRTDLERMLVSRFFTLWLVPLGIFLSAMKWLPISPVMSIGGALIGYVALFLCNKLFKSITKKDGLGEGDMDLLALIGSFTGIYGVWITLLVGSILGSILGISLILFGKLTKDQPMPFGPFLALGAILSVMLYDSLAKLFFCY